MFSVPMMTSQFLAWRSVENGLVGVKSDVQKLAGQYFLTAGTLQRIFTWIKYFNIKYTNAMRYSV